MHDILVKRRQLDMIRPGFYLEAHIILAKKGTVASSVIMVCGSFQALWKEHVTLLDAHFNFHSSTVMYRMLDARLLFGGRSG